MAATLEAIRDCSRELLEQARSRADEATLTKLIAMREEQIRQLPVDTAGPPAFTRAELEGLLTLDQEVMEALRRRRDELWQELSDLRRGRCAESAYRHDTAGPSRFLDRES